MAPSPGQAGVHAVAAVGGRSCLQRTAEQRGTLAHPDQAEAGARCRASGGAPRPSSTTSISNASGPVAERHLGDGGAGVSQGVRSVPPGRSDRPTGRPPPAVRTGSPSRLTTHCETRRPQRLGQLVELGQPRLWRHGPSSPRPGAHARRAAGAARATHPVRHPRSSAGRRAPGRVGSRTRRRPLPPARRSRRHCGRSRRATRGRCAPARRPRLSGPPPGSRCAGCGRLRRAPTRPPRRRA